VAKRKGSGAGKPLTPAEAAELRRRSQALGRRPRTLRRLRAVEKLLDRLEPRR
jgi:hypothetical protein